MWINIEDNSIEDLCKIKNPCDPNALALNQLLDSFLNGKHIVYLSIKTIEKILNISYINKSNESLLKWIYNNYVNIYSVKTYFKYCINTSTKFDNIFFDQNNKSYNIPLHKLTDIRETYLITENECDYDFYINLFKIVNKDKNNTEYYDIKLENESCHGSNICSKINHTAANDRIALCILDNDKNYNDGAYGTTYKGALNEYKNIKSKSIILLQPLISREKENLISPSIYSSFSIKSVLIEVLKQFENESNIIRFFDIKDGIECKLYNDCKFKQYYKSVIKVLNDRKLILKPTNPNNKNYDEKKKCIVGIGDKADLIMNVLANGIDKINNNDISTKDRRKINNLIKNLNISNHDYFPKYIVEEWKWLYELLFNWGCCLNRNNSKFSCYFKTK